MDFSVGLFIDAILLWLYDDAPNNRKLITQILEIYDKDVSAGSVYTETDQFRFYSTLIKLLIENDIRISSSAELVSLLLKFKANPLLTKDPGIYENLEKIFTGSMVVDTNRLTAIRTELNDKILHLLYTRTVKRMFSKLNGFSSTTDKEKQHSFLKDVSALCSEVIEIDNAQEETMTDTSRLREVTTVDFTDKKSIRSGRNTYVSTNKANVIKTGWQALNRAMGPAGGITLGETVVLNALSFNCKSKMLLNLARWAATLNKLDSSIKNPLCLVFSLENETPQNLMMFYTDAYINHYKKLPEPDVTDEEIVEFVHEYYNRMGWKFVVDRRLGAEFGFQELVQVFESYIRDGYTPVMCVIDYMNKCKKGSSSSGDTNVSNHLYLADLYSKVCNYLKSKNCILATAHQLNREAAKIAASGCSNIVQRFNTSHLADGMDPQREIDVAFYMHIEKNMFGDSYLTMKIDKHRYDTQTPDGDKYFAYPFDKLLGILDDYNDVDTSSRNIYAEKPLNPELVTEHKPIMTDALF